MTRVRPILAGTLAALVLGASPAAASVVQLGLAPDKTKPGCPAVSTCRVITRTTAYQVQSGTSMQPLQVRQAGRIVSMSLRLGDPSKSEIHSFDGRFGGTSRVAVTVLRATRRKTLIRKVVAEGPLVHVQPYFGGVSDFPLTTTLPVRKGDYVALTIPTWAPILAVGLSPKYAWRAARASNRCGDQFLASPTFLTTVGATGTFGCKYSAGRLTYTVTEVTTPKRRYDSKQNPIKP
jgi:hypothetical protein